MIKQGTRKALRREGTVLIAESSITGYDDSGNRRDLLVGGDLIILTGKQDGPFVEGVIVANGQKLEFERHWLLNNTSLAFDARVIMTAEDG